MLDLRIPEGAQQRLLGAGPLGWILLAALYKVTDALRGREA